MAAVVRVLRLTLPALHQLDSAYAVWFLEMSTTAMVMLILLSFLGLLGFHTLPDDMLDCVAAYAATAAFTLSFGLLLALIIRLAPGFRHFQGIMMMILFMTSGFGMLIDRMPPELRKILAWNPLVHCVEWFREGFYANYECFTLDKEYLLTVTVGFLLFGLAGERALRRHDPSR